MYSAWLKDHLTVKCYAVTVMNGRNDKNMIVTDLKWLKKIICGLFNLYISQFMG